MAEASRGGKGVTLRSPAPKQHPPAMRSNRDAHALRWKNVSRLKEFPDRARRRLNRCKQKRRAAEVAARRPVACGNAAAQFMRALLSKNRAWLIAAFTVPSWKGLVIRQVGSGRSPVSSRSG